MRIAIDATAIPPNKAGAGFYIFNLVRGLAEIDRENQYFVFAKPSDILDWGIEQGNFLFTPSASRARPLRLLWEQIILPLRLNKYDVQILHSPHYTAPLLRGGCRSVVTFCDMTFYLCPQMHSLIKRSFFRTLMPLTAARADALIAISESTKKDMVKLLGISEAKIQVTLLAPADHFKPVNDASMLRLLREKYGILRSFILYVGVLEPRKNVPTLIRSYHNLLKRGVEHQLVITGKKGWAYEEIFRLVTDLRLQDHVIFTDYVPDSDMPALYSAADLFVYPSVYEGFGIPLLEAMACGVPAISSNISSMPEIVGDAGLLVDPYNDSQLTEAMYLVISNRALHQDLIEKGLTRAKEFSWEKTAKETLAVYERVMTRGDNYV